MNKIENMHAELDKLTQQKAEIVKQIRNVKNRLAVATLPYAPGDIVEFPYAGESRTGCVVCAIPGPIFESPSMIVRRRKTDGTYEGEFTVHWFDMEKVKLVKKGGE